MSATLQITLVEGAKDALVGFPFNGEQWIDFAVEEENLVDVALGDADDTTAQQEQFLDTNDQVVSYSVKH